MEVRKSRAKRLLSIKKPTEKTKARITRNDEQLAVLRTKLKFASKAPKEEKKPEGQWPHPARDVDAENEPVKKPEVKDPKAKRAKSRFAAVERKVNEARKAYTEARLNEKAHTPEQILGLKAAYQSAFRAYQKAKETSQSSDDDAEFLPYSYSAPGRYDPIVLAYNYIMGIRPTSVRKL